MVSGVNEDTRTIYIVGIVDAMLAYLALAALEKLDSTKGEIRIVLNSFGGEEANGYAIYDAIMRCRNKVSINCYGATYSIAAVILQAGDERWMSPNTDLLIHNGTVGTGGEEIEQDTILEMADRIKQSNGRYYAILAARSGQPLDRIEGWCKSEKFINAEECLRLGFADGILAPTKVHKKKKGRK
jgi:ATP-dependent Clp protease protease subunit